jgi:peptidoglycan/xylan/chitin deacetylase (PgdA/CDA1 family)
MVRLAPFASPAASPAGNWRACLRYPVLVTVIGKLTGLVLIAANPWIGFVVYYGADLFLLWHLFVPSSRGICPAVTHFNTDRREVWLTIDDGPDPEDTPRILELLARHDARAAFFPIGERVAVYPELVDVIVRAGHEVGHHTLTHPVASFWGATPALVRLELDRGLAVLRSAGATPRYFRPPAGIRSIFLRPALDRLGLRCVCWSIRSLDRFSKNPSAVVNRVMRQVRPGAIILVHEGPCPAPGVRAETLARLLDALTAAGYRCVIPEEESLR